MIPIIIKTIADISLLKPQDMYIIVPVGLDYQNPLTFITTDMERLLIEEAIYNKFKTDTVIIKDDKSLNAFSIAGGRIYITTRMINYANTLDELAFVIAHEIAHVEQKHAARKIQTIIASRYYLAENGDFGAAIANALTSPFGQIDEYQADRAGADLVIAAGYDARKGLDFFERMATTERYDSIEKMVRTHPYSAERYACLHDYLNQKGK